MSLRDEHLAKALKHAPDSDLAPSETVRKKVLEHAANIAKQASQKPHGYWFVDLLQKTKNWQWAGMSSVAVALLAILMLREQLPPEMTQPDAAPKVLAQNSAPDKALKEKRADMAAASIQEMVPARIASRDAKEKAEAPIAPEMVDKTVIAALPEVLAPSLQSAPAELAKQDDSVAAQNTAKVEAAPAASASVSDAVADAEKKSEAENSNAAAKNSVTLVDSGALGVAKANRDIQAGVLRILVAEWPADKPLVDETTGYRVYLATDLVPEELAAYNQTMRDWFNTQH